MSSVRKQENGSESARTKKEKARRIVQILRNKAKTKKKDGIIKMDPHYFILNKYSKPIDDHRYAYDERVVHESRNEERSQVKEDADDGSYSDVEILDSTEFNKMSSRYKDTAEFRHKVISDLKKPFDEEEYQTLWRDVQHNSLKERHLELRHGRERPVITQDKGKSYLDHYPVLKTKLLEAGDDRPRCLNLLRGFFLWIKQPEGGFCPWLNEECLATYPGPVVSYF